MSGIRSYPVWRRSHDKLVSKLETVPATARVFIQAGAYRGREIYKTMKPLRFQKYNNPAKPLHPHPTR